MYHSIGAAQAAVEIVRRGPAQGGFGARGVDLVAEIVAGTVGDEMDQPLARAGRVGAEFVQRCAQMARTTSRLAARLAGADGQRGAGLGALEARTSASAWSSTNSQSRWLEPSP